MNISWIRTWPRIGFVRNVAVLAGSTALGQGLVILISPILTRLYDPVAFGTLTVYTSIVAVVSVVAALRYEVAIPLPEDDATASDLLGLALVVILLMGGLIGIATWQIGNRIVSWVNTPALVRYLWLLPLSLVGIGTYQSLTFWAVRKKEFGKIARTKLSQSAGMIVAQLSLGLLHFGALGLLLGDLIGRVSGVGALAASAWKQDHLVLRQITPAGMQRVAVRYRRFPFLSSGAALLNNLGVALPSLLLAALYGPQVVGWFALGQRVMSAPLNLIAVSVGQVYVSESAKAVYVSPERLPRLLAQILGGMFAVAFPYVGLVVWAAPRLFPLIFGSEWIQAGFYVQILAVMFLLEAITSSTGGTLDVLERQDLHLIREVVRILLMSAAVILAKSIGARPTTGIALFSVAGSMSCLAYVGISLFAIRAHLKSTR